MCKFTLFRIIRVSRFKFKGHACKRWWVSYLVHDTESDPYWSWLALFCENIMSWCVHAAWSSEGTHHGWAGGGTATWESREGTNIQRNHRKDLCQGKHPKIGQRTEVGIEKLGAMAGMVPRRLCTPPTALFLEERFSRKRAHLILYLTLVSKMVKPYETGCTL